MRAGLGYINHIKSKRRDEIVVLIPKAMVKHNLNVSLARNKKYLLKSMDQRRYNQYITINCPPDPNIHSRPQSILIYHCLGRDLVRKLPCTKARAYSWTPSPVQAPQSPHHRFHSIQGDSMGKAAWDQTG